MDFEKSKFKYFRIKMRIKLFLVKFLNKINDHFFSKIIKKRGRLSFNKENLYSWMNLTKKQRYDLTKRESLTYLTQRKNLLNKIRNEYKNIIEKN